MSQKQYFEILNKDEQSFLEEFQKCLEGKAIIQNYHSDIQRLLIVKPYPLLQILQSNYNAVKFYIQRIISGTLYELLQANKKNSKLSAKFLNFLSNFPIEFFDEQTNLQKQLLRYLIKQIPSSKTEILLVLLARSDIQLLALFLKQLEITWSVHCHEALPCKELILQTALKQQKHFLPMLLSQLIDFQCIGDRDLRNDLLILKIINTCNNDNQTLDTVVLNKHFEMLKEITNEVQNFFFNDFQRLEVLLMFLSKHAANFKEMKIIDLLQASSITRWLFTHKIDASYEDTYHLIETCHSYELQVASNTRMCEQELNTLTYYSALCIVYELISQEKDISTTQEKAEQQLQKLNGLIRKIRGLVELCSLIEDIFQIVFLRWEQIHNDNSNSERQQTATKLAAEADGVSPHTDGDDDNYYDGDPTHIAHSTLSNLARRNKRHGFICHGNALQQIYAFLKKVVTKRLHTESYKNSPAGLQKRFQDIIDIINEALWKYSVLEKIVKAQEDNRQNQTQCLRPEELLQLVQLHAETFEKALSDEENRECSNLNACLMRRKVKNRRRATFSGEPVIAKPTENPTLTLTQWRKRFMEMTPKSSAAMPPKGSIIPKMLCTPENLAIMALGTKNFNDVKYIIETFRLENSVLNRELIFLEQQQIIKKKLSHIYKNYLQEEAQVAPLATVEQIKNVAAKGFEMSKIISLVDNFAQAQRIQQSHELRQLFEKFAKNTQYAFLDQFMESNLNAIIVTDLIIDLPFNREITSNLLMVIRRQQQIKNFNGNCNHAENRTESSTQEQLQLPREIGPMALLKQLCECMHLLEQSCGDKKAPVLNELLYDNFYSLKSAKLSQELRRERVFHLLYKKVAGEYGHCRDLKSHAVQFRKIKLRCNYYAQFCAYVEQLKALIQLRDPNIVYHTSELLKQDPYDVIGELIYDCNMTPMEIEAIVLALNLNIVHVIAVNTCPEIVGKAKRFQQPNESTIKLEAICKYIEQRNPLLGQLLKATQSGTELALGVGMEDVFLKRLLALPELAKFEKLYGDNRVIAALRADNLCADALDKMDSKLDQLEILLLDIGVQGEKTLTNKQIDRLIMSLIDDDSKNIYLAGHIRDIRLRAKLLRDNFTKMSTTRMAKELIECILHHKDSVRLIDKDLRSELEHTLADITTYAKVTEVLNFESWPQAYDFGLKTPNTIFEKLLQCQEYQLCYEWCRVVKLGELYTKHEHMFVGPLLAALLELNDDVAGVTDVNEFLLKIFELFPLIVCVDLLDKNKDKFRSLHLFGYAIDFLEQHHKSCNYRNYKVSLKILAQLTQHERRYFWHLMRFPLLIIEQLIINAKIELLGVVIATARSVLKLEHDVCGYCFDKRGNVYDIHMKGSTHKVRFQLGQDATVTAANSAFILLNFNLYKLDHIVTNECIDFLLRIYATKALDYQVADTTNSEPYSQNTDTQMSLDSLCGAFEIPKEAPKREDWIRDDEATHCMCCKRTAFTMLMRRHHCRRCGRVVCYACSMHRMRIAEIYDEIEVRVCNDCWQHNTEQDKSKQEQALGQATDDQGLMTLSTKQRLIDGYKWRLSGNITHDKLLREEFCYEHAPSVGLSLSILGYHMTTKKCVDLLLYHCCKLEKLFVPNPEVDYELVAKMMNCLAIAAKVRGGPAEVESIREHSEIIMSVVQKGCEALLPAGPLNNHSLRKLGDALVQAEHWPLALEVHLKCGFPTAGVMAAHGLACLRAGCYETAREKFSHCMMRVTTELTNASISAALFNKSVIYENLDSVSNQDIEDNMQIKRPLRGPPLLQEILKLIASIPHAKPQPETLRRASLIRSSNHSLASLFTRRKETYQVVTPLHEPALNVLNALANLKNITKGQYADGGVSNEPSSKQLFTRAFEESLHYVLSYGSHADVIEFLMKKRELLAVLKYFNIQQLEMDFFTQNIFLPCLKTGQITHLIEFMQKIDDANLTLWHVPLIHTCRYLEQHKLWNSLYQLQLLLNDPIRASMTCVKFYSMNCESFQQLHANAIHLRNAHLHLQTELELSQWGKIEFEVKSQSSSRRSSNVSISPSTSTSTQTASLAMQMDARALNQHINTILRQQEVAKFLAHCEEQRTEESTLTTLKFLKQIRHESSSPTLPTLFDGQPEKIQLCILILLCGKNVDEGFGLTYRIIQDYKLSPMKVFGATAKFLARNQRLAEVDKLVNCITANNDMSVRDIDELLSIAINFAINSHEPDVKSALDNLAKKISNIELRISSHIFIGQLKSAYLLANKYERLGDIRKILRQAELTNQIHIKKLCEKKLNMHASLTAPTL